MSMEQLVKKLKIPEDEIDKKAKKLAKKGIIFNQPSSSGVMVYRLLPLVVVGTFEYTFMQTLPDTPEGLARLKKLAGLYEKLMHELRDKIQEGYENILPMFAKQPPVDRTIPIFQAEDGVEIPINKEVSTEEAILPAQTLKRAMTDITVKVIPGIGELSMIVDGVTGKNLITK